MCVYLTKGVRSWYISQANYLMELCVFTFICLCGLMHSSSPLLSSSQLIPQFVFLTVGLTGATFYLIRLARGPHVT